MASIPRQQPLSPKPDADPPDFVVVDVETACSRVSSICQIGIIGFKDGVEVFAYGTLLDRFSSFNTRIHGVTCDHVVGAPNFWRHSFRHRRASDESDHCRALLIVRATEHTGIGLAGWLSSMTRSRGVAPKASVRARRSGCALYPDPVPVVAIRDLSGTAT